jgi:phosphatidylserine decarboxylase
MLPHEPDMPKKAENVTQEEMQDAKRRIEGSLAPSSGKAAFSAS